jgi:uncharacterized protein YyaL (SSP411 family)
MFELEEILKLRNDDQYLKDRMDSLIDRFIEEREESSVDIKSLIYRSAIMLSYVLHNTDSLEEDELIEASNEIYHRYIRSINLEEDNSF